MVFTEYSKRLMPSIRRWLSITLAVGAMGMTGPVWAELPAIQNYGGVDYLTGGFGIDESTAIKKAMPDFPLALLFSASDGTRSAYVSKVQVVVRDQYDATVLNVESQGPFLLARLQPGTYQVHATYRNQTQSRPVTVVDNKNTRMVFEWAREDDTSKAERSANSTSDSGAASTSDSNPEFTPGSIPGVN